MANELTYEEKLQGFQIKLQEAENESVESCNFYSFADMLVEIYPGDHPLIERSFAEKANADKGNLTPTAFNNPYENKGAVVAFGRACMRFVLDEDSLVAHINHLTGILEKLKEANDPQNEFNPDIKPAIVSMERPEYQPEVKQFSTLRDDGIESENSAVLQIEPAAEFVK